MTKLDFNKSLTLYSIDLDYLNNQFHNFDFSLYQKNEKEIKKSIYFLIQSIIEDSFNKQATLTLRFLEDCVFFQISDFLFFIESNKIRFEIDIKDLLLITCKKSSSKYFSTVLNSYKNDYFDLEIINDFFYKTEIISSIFQYPFINKIKNTNLFYKDFNIDNKNEYPDNINEYLTYNFDYFNFVFNLKRKLFLFELKNFKLEIFEEIFKEDFYQQSVSLHYSNDIEINKSILLSILNTGNIKYSNLNEFIKLNSLINY